MTKHGGLSLAIGVLTGLFLFVWLLPDPVHSSTPTATPYPPPLAPSATYAPLPTFAYPEPPTAAPLPTRTSYPTFTPYIPWWTYTPGPYPTRYPTDPYQPTFTPWQTVTYPTLPYPYPWPTVIATFIMTPRETLPPASTATPWIPGTPWPSPTAYPYPLPGYPYPPAATSGTPEYYPPPGTPTRSAYPTRTLIPTWTLYRWPPTPTRYKYITEQPYPYPYPPLATVTLWYQTPTRRATLTAAPTNPPAPTKAPQATQKSTSAYPPEATKPPAPTAQPASPEPPQPSPSAVDTQTALAHSPTLSSASQNAIVYLAEEKGIPAQSLLVAQDYPVYFPNLNRQIQAVNLLDIRPNGKVYKLLVDLGSGQVIEDVSSMNTLENLARGARRANQQPGLSANHKAFQSGNLERDASGPTGELVQSAAGGMDPAQYAWKFALEYALFPALVVLVVLTVLALVQAVMGKK